MNNDLETFVILKYGYPSLTSEYLSTLPALVILRLITLVGERDGLNVNMWLSKSKDADPLKLLITLYSCSATYRENMENYPSDEALVLEVMNELIAYTRELHE